MQHYLQQPGHGSNWSAHQQTTGLGRCDIHVYTHNDTMELLLRHNKNKILSFTATQVNLGNILSEVRKRQLWYPLPVESKK